MKQYSALLSCLLMSCLDAQVGKPEYTPQHHGRDEGVVSPLPDAGAGADRHRDTPTSPELPDINDEPDETANHAPQIYLPDSSLRIPEQFSLNVLVRAEDPDDDSVHLRLLNSPGPSNFLFEPSNGGSSVSGVFTWTPGCTEAGTYSFTFEAQDTRGAIALASLDILVDEACDECREGERMSVSCSRPDSPCVGSMERVCINSQWQDRGECNGLIPIGEGQTVIDPRVSGENVAYVVQGAQGGGEYDLFVHNLRDGTRKNVVGLAVPDGCAVHLLNYANDKLLVQTCNGNFIQETSAAHRQYSIRDRNCLPNDELDLDRLICQGENALWLSQFNRPEAASMFLYNNICVPSRYPHTFDFSQQMIIFPSTNPGEQMDECLPGWEGMHLLIYSPFPDDAGHSIRSLTLVQEGQYDFFPHFLGVHQPEAVFFLRQFPDDTIHWMLHSFINGAAEEITPFDRVGGRRDYQQGEIHTSQNTVLMLDQVYNAGNPNRSKVLLYRRPYGGGGSVVGEYFLPVPMMNEADLHCDIRGCTAVFRDDKGNAYACSLSDEWR